MKKIIFAASLFLASFSAFAGLGENFVASDGKVFQIHSALSVEKGANVIYVKQASGTVQPFADSTGAVWNKVVSVLNSSNHYVKNPTSDRWYNTYFTTEISCISSQTVLGYPTNAPAEWISDNCALHQAIKNASN